MNIVELYSQVPADRHQEIAISGDRLFFENEEYIVGGDGELSLIRTDKELLSKVEQIRDELNISK